MKQLFLLSHLFLFGLLLTGCNKEQKRDIPLTKAVEGTFYLEIHEEGELEAIQSINVLSPRISWRYGNLKITQLVKDGTEVEAGDTLVVFDPSEVRSGVLDAESRLEMNIAELAKMEAQHRSDLEELNADLEITRLAYEISGIRFESAGYEADIRKKEIELNLEKAKISYERAKEQLENRMKIQTEEIKQRKLSINQDRARLEDAHETMEMLSLISPSPGIAIVNRNSTTGNKFQVGDQCWAGVPLIQLPDLSALRATVNINEVDISKIKTGLKVEIKPDAFSESIYIGEVTKVANLAISKNNNSNIKVFPVEITIYGSDSRLLPGLTVSCRIILGEISDAVSVPIEAVFSDGIEQFVYKKTASGFEKTSIITGDSNRNHVVVLSGIEPGTEIALTDPFINTVEKNGSEKK